MSIRCAFMSSRPSSNTANNPHGPAPMITTSVLIGSLMMKRLLSRLPFGRPDDETVEFGRHLDLAGQPRVRPHIETEIEHVFFHRRRPAGLLQPGLVDINVARRAGAGAAAFRLDTGNAVLDRVFHHRRPSFGFHNAGLALGIDVVDFGHEDRTWKWMNPPGGRCAPYIGSAPSTPVRDPDWSVAGDARDLVCAQKVR